MAAGLVLPCPHNYLWVRQTILDYLCVFHDTFGHGASLRHCRKERVVGKVPEENVSMPAAVAAIKHCGFACWAGGAPPPNLIGRFDDSRIPVENVRHVRIWGLQVDDERELPGHERTSIPDEDIWQVTLRANDGSRFEVNSNLLVAVSPD